MSPRPAEEHTRTGIYKETRRLVRAYADAADVPAVEFLRRLVANYGPEQVRDLTSPGRIEGRPVEDLNHG